MEERDEGVLPFLTCGSHGSWCTATAGTNKGGGVSSTGSSTTGSSTTGSSATGSSTIGSSATGQSCWGGTLRSGIPGPGTSHVTWRVCGEARTPTPVFAWAQKKSAGKMELGHRRQHIGAAVNASPGDRGSKSLFLCSFLLAVIVTIAIVCEGLPCPGHYRALCTPVRLVLIMTTWKRDWSA